MEQIPISRNFSLENGAAHLKHHFSEVDCVIYPDSLVITEEKPLTDYIQSFWEPVLSKTQLATCASKIKNEINQFGEFAVQKSTGLIVAYKA